MMTVLRCLANKLALTCILSATLSFACDHSARIKPGKNANMTGEQKLHLLQVFADAWNKHDSATLKACMTEDCVFKSSAGPDVWDSDTQARKQLLLPLLKCSLPSMMLSGATPATS